MNIAIERPFAATEKGGRRNNEDFIYPPAEMADTTQRLFMVCDGVGGMEKGEIASALACDSFHTFFHTFLEGDLTEDFVNRAVRYTESRFDEYVSLHPEAQGMATTVTMLYVGVSKITVAHIGDSRIYQFRNGEIMFQTDDHSLVNSWVKLGKITQAEASIHPQKNVITRAITGAQRSVTADVVNISDIQVGDIFFLCTDGVTDCFTDDSLKRLFLSGKSAEHIKNTLVEKCHNFDGDNFSFYIIPIQSVQKNAGYRQYLSSLLSLT